MKIFDCFKFFNELELLDLRLMALNDLVDYFVLVEANKTHTGKPKEFLFEKNKHLFSNYLNKIIYVKVTDLPTYTKENIWIPENFQRNCIDRGLEGRAAQGDKIIVSDIDELPNPDVIRENLNCPQPVTMIQKLFYYHVNCLQNQLWAGTIMATYKQYQNCQQLRNSARNGYNSRNNGGWHYSFMGGAERIKTKVENIAESHLIIDQIGNVNDINNKISSQTDLWNRTDDYAKKQLVNINEAGMAPKCIKQFIEKYPTFYFNG
jgi:beta-1,4-mannosyl-glycoprotein beta-1,4-N-acetylglucosaminyltransferase